MPNNYFSPTNKVSGGALFASWNSKDGCVYLKLLKQIANNPDKKGNFDGKNPLNIKLSQDEIAGIIRAINYQDVWKLYHSFEDDKTTGQFSFYEMDSKDKAGNPVKRRGFGLSVKRNEQEVKVGFTLDSAERFKFFLQHALTHIFDAEYSADKKAFEEYQKKKVVSAPKSEKAKGKDEYIPSAEEATAAEPEAPGDEWET